MNYNGMILMRPFDPRTAALQGRIGNDSLRRYLLLQRRLDQRGKGPLEFEAWADWAFDGERNSANAAKASVRSVLERTGSWEAYREAEAHVRSRAYPEGALLAALHADGIAQMTRSGEGVVQAISSIQNTSWTWEGPKGKVGFGEFKASAPVILRDSGLACEVVKYLDRLVFNSKINTAVWHIRHAVSLPTLGASPKIAAEFVDWVGETVLGFLNWEGELLLRISQGDNERHEQAEWK